MWPGPEPESRRVAGNIMLPRRATTCCGIINQTTAVWDKQAKGNPVRVEPFPLLIIGIS